ncbi:MAG: hypothetical protein QM296_10110 [Bacillota bacterium]|nr:hypothetical protein [Bacillota bacterium]
MLNNLILMPWLLAIAAAWLRRRPDWAVGMAGFYCLAAPSLVLPSGRAINPTYPLTLLLLVLVLLDGEGRGRWRERFSPRAPLGGYVAMMAVVALCYGAGFAFNGNEGWKAFFSIMVGYANVWLLLLLLALLLLRLPAARQLETMLGLTVALVVTGLVFSVLQRGFYQIGWPLTWQLYQTDSHQAPLLAMQEEGVFSRSFGPFYSPTIFGTSLLLSIGVLAAIIIRPTVSDPVPVRRQRLLALPLLGLSISLGIFAFAKSVIIGVPFMLLYSLLLLPPLLVLRRRLDGGTGAGKLRLDGDFRAAWRRSVSELARPLAVMAVVAFFAYFITWFLIPSWQPGARAYYYGFLINPFGSLETRYGLPTDMINIDRPPRDGGILISALLQFFEHPVFGVGPLAVAGEFLGDSQINKVLHNGGIVAALAYVVFYARLYWLGLGSKDRVIVILTPLVLLGCLATPLLDTRQSVPVLALLLARGVGVWEQGCGGSAAVAGGGGTATGGGAAETVAED